MASLAKHIPISDGTSKAWIQFASNGAENDGFNISSTVDAATGDYQFNLISAFANTTYAAVATVDSSGNNDRICSTDQGSTSRMDVYVFDVSSAGSVDDDGSYIAMGTLA